MSKAKGKDPSKGREGTRDKRRGSESAAAGRRRLWGYRAAAMLVPLFVLAVVEGVLRVAQVGYDPHFLRRTEVQGQTMWVENADFSKRFFPPGLERTPQALMLPADKDQGATRLLIFGESAAMGDPDAAYGFGRFLEVLLRHGRPGDTFEVANMAFTAINSHVLREMAREAAQCDGDIWILYMGNNEVVGPYGAGTVFQDKVPSLGMIRAGLALQSTRVGQVLQAGLRRWGQGSRAAPSRWEGMEMFLDRQVTRDDPHLARIYDHFEANLREMIEYGRKAGARVLVLTVASNLKDCAPLASEWPRWDSETEKALWRGALDEGMAGMQAGRWSEALSRLEQAQGLWPRHALTHYLKAACLWRLGKKEESRQSFLEARDLDTLRFRADTRINETIREVAASYPDDQVRLFDAEKLMDRHSAEGIAGDTLFWEHVHYRPEGNLVLARGLAEALGPWLGGDEFTNAAPLADEACYRHVALTPWDRAELVDEMSKRMALAPFKDQWGSAPRARKLEEEMARWEAAMTSQALTDALEQYALLRRTFPRDALALTKHAEFLEEIGRVSEAVEVWRELAAWRPGRAGPYYRLANALDKLGQSREAVELFERALQWQPDLSEARNGLALALAAQGQHARAKSILEEVLRRNPDFAEARVNYGQMLAQEGRDDLAEAEYRRALEINSNSVAARLNLGRLLMRRERWQEAEGQYREAVSLAPRQALAHYYLGQALAPRDAEEAVAAFRRAVELEPGLVPARMNLGLALARSGRVEEGLEVLAGLAGDHPEMVEARFNYGVALAKLQRFEEASREFGEVLRLDPEHSEARAYLRMTQGR